MRVAILVDAVGCTSGVSTTYKNLESKKDKINHKIKFFVSKSTKSSIKLGSEKESVVYTSDCKLDGFTRGVPINIPYFKVYNSISHFEPHVIHITGPGPLGMTGLLYGSLNSAAVVAFNHVDLKDVVSEIKDGIVCRKLLPKVSEVIEKLIYNSCDGVISHTEKRKKHSYAKNYKVYSGVEANFFDALDDEKKDAFLSDNNRKSNRFYENSIGYLGRYSQEKNIDLILDISKLTPNTSFFTAGEGPLERDIEEAENVYNLGVLARSEVKAFLNDVDALILPSKSDQFGKAALEAMACGTPVFLTENVGISETLEEGTHYFEIEPSNVEQSAYRLTRIMHYDRLLESVGSSAQKAVSGLTYSNMFRSLVKVWEEIGGSNEE